MQMHPRFFRDNSPVPNRSKVQSKMHYASKSEFMITRDESDPHSSSYSFNLPPRGVALGLKCHPTWCTRFSFDFRRPFSNIATARNRFPRALAKNIIEKVCRIGASVVCQVSVVICNFNKCCTFAVALGWRGWLGGSVLRVNFSSKVPLLRG